MRELIGCSMGVQGIEDTENIQSLTHWRKCWIVDSLKVLEILE